MNVPKLRISLNRDSALTVTRLSVESDRLVYVIVVERPRKYRHGRSKIVYIGTTKRGVARVAQSAAAKAEAVLRQHGVKRFDVRIVTCRPRQRVKTWRKLERAMLLTFREVFGEVPELNTQGTGIRELDEFDYFSRSRVRSLVQDLST